MDAHTRRERRLEITPAEVGQKVEAILTKRLRGKAPGHVAKLIRQGRVLISAPNTEERPAGRGDRIEEGQTVVLLAPKPGPPKAPQPNRRLWFQVLHADEHLIVVGKPPRVPVSPGPGHGTNALLNGLVARYPDLLELGFEREFGLVHRLDKDTSGLLLVARTPEAYTTLVEAFTERRIQKTYTAFTTGTPEPPTGTVDLPVDGKEALSRYRVVDTAGPVAQVELSPLTGRTHQLRIHLASLKTPVLADPIHGAGLTELTARLYMPRLALHAARLSLTHPITGAPLEAELPIPKDMRKAWRRAERTFKKS